MLNPEAKSWLEGYCASKKIAKELCWAVARSPVCFNPDVEEIEEYGWVISFDCIDRKTALGNLKLLLKKDFHKIEWT